MKPLDMPALKDIYQALKLLSVPVLAIEQRAEGWYIDFMNEACHQWMGGKQRNFVGEELLVMLKELFQGKSGELYNKIVNGIAQLTDEKQERATFDIKLQIDEEEAGISVGISILAQKTKPHHYLIEWQNPIPSYKSYQQSLYDRLIETIAGVFWEADASTLAFTYVSPQVKDLLGYSAEEWLSEPDFWQNHIHPEDKESAINFCHKELKAERDHIFKYRFLTKSGRYKYLQDRVSVVRQAGKVSKLRGLIIDIDAEQKDTEELLRRKAELQKILNRSLDIICTVDAEGKFASVNEASEKIIGYSPEEMLGRSINDFIINEDHYLLKEAAKKLLSGEEVKVIENRYRHKNGEIIYMVWSVSWVEDDQVLYCVGRDASKQKKAEQEIQLMLNNTEEAFVLIDNRLEIVSYNQQFFNLYHQFFGGKIKKGASILNYAQQERIPILEKLYSDVLSGKSFNVLLPVRHKNKGDFVFSMHYKPALDTNGNIVGAFVTATDVTLREEALRQIKLDNERFSYISKASNDAIYDWDIVNKNFQWGEGYQRIFGHPLDHATTTKEWESVIHPSEIERILKDLNEALNDPLRKSYNNQYRYLKADGKYAYVEEMGYIIRNEEGEAIRMLGALRDVSFKEDENQRKAILASISDTFNQFASIEQSMKASLEAIADHGNFKLAEIWLIDMDRKQITLSTQLSCTQLQQKFVTESADLMKLKIGEGLPGYVWRDERIHYWQDIQNHPSFLRKKAASVSGVDDAYGIPLYYHHKIIGVLVLALSIQNKPGKEVLILLENLSTHLGAEIERKKMEIELYQFFHNSPDILIIASPDGYFKKVNPAFCNLLGYTEEELLSTPFITLIHPDDINNTTQEFEVSITSQRKAANFENRYKTKNGEWKWISWSSSEVFSKDGLAFGFGRDITIQKELRNQLTRAYQLAKIGTWEVDLIRGVMKWDAIVCELHETSPDYKPDLEGGSGFYKEGWSRERIEALAKRCMEEGKPWDEELVIVTAKGNERWVRVIGEGVFENGKCIKIYGSFQDIHERKHSELRLKHISDNIPGAIFQYHVDKEGNDHIYFLSQGCYELWGMSPEECMQDLGKVWSQIRQGGDYDTMQQSIAESARKMERWYFQWRSRHPGGSVRWHEGHGTPHRLADGSTLWDSLIMDVTEKKELEDLLEKASELAKIGSWEITFQNGEQNEIFWSSMTKKIMEVEASYQPKLADNFGFYLAESKAKIQIATDTIIRNGKSFDLELLLQTAKGNTKWVRCIGNADFIDSECRRIYGSFQDIDRIKTTERKLSTKTQYLEAISEINSILINYDEWTDAIFQAFEKIGNTLGTNYVYFFRYSTDDNGQKIISQLLEWERGNKYPVINAKNLQKLPAYYMGENIDALISGKIVTISMADLEEGPFKKILKKQGIQSMLKAPLYVGRRFWGFIGCDEKSYEREWNQDEKGFLFTVATNLSSAIENYETDLAVKIKSKLLGINAEVVEVLLQNKNWQEVLPKCLEMMGNAVDADRAYFLKNDIRDSGKIYSTQLFEWTNGKVSAQIDNPYYQNLDLSQFPEFLEQAKQGEHIQMTLPEEGEFYDVLNEQDIKSFLNIPVMVDGLFYGYIGFDDCKRRRVWNKEEVSFLRTLASNLGAAVERSQQLLQIKNAYEERNSILESIGDAFFSVDKRWIVNYWNNTAERFLGVRKEQILGKNLWDVFSDATEHISFVNYSKAMTTGKAIHFEDYYEPVNTWFEISAYPSKSGLSVYFKDVSIRKRAEESIRLSNERFQKVTEATNDAIWDWDIENDTLYRGTGFNALFGYDVDKVLHADNFWKDNFHPADAEKVKGSLETAILDKNTTHWELEYRIIKADKSIAVVIDRGVIIRDKKGKAVRMVGAMTNITHRKQYELKLKKLNRRLKKHAHQLELSNKELEQFAYVASHDLQEPLRMVTSFLSQLERKYGEVLDEKAHQYIYFAVDGAKRMRQIILDLLEYSRMGRISEENEAVDINEVVSEARLLYRKKIDELKATIDSDKLPTIVAAKSPVRQLFQNLINNALTYASTDRPPHIIISSSKTKTHWKFSIKDNGIGIAPEYFDKIFIIFQRLHTKDRYEGTGMGLAICKKIVESYGGDIWVESTEGEGSTFSFTLSRSKVNL